MDQQPQRSWWGRNWMWLVPVGCLAPLVLCCGGGSLIFVLVFGALKSSDTYKESLERAKANDEVQALLGTPIEEGYIVSGKINVSGTSGDADLSIPLSGPKGSATLYVVAKKTAGQWKYSTMEVVGSGSSTRINLLRESDKKE